MQHNQIGPSQQHRAHSEDQKKPMLRERTDKAWFSHLLQHL